MEGFWFYPGFSPAGAKGEKRVEGGSQCSRQKSQGRIYEHSTLIFITNKYNFPTLSEKTTIFIFGSSPKIEIWALFFAGG